MAIGLVALTTMAGQASAERVAPLLVCSKGPSGQHFDVNVRIPARVEANAIYTVRIDGVSSGKISQFGLNYLHDMTVEYVLPAGASYVEGSAHLIPGTGTANVLVSPRLTQHGGVITMVLPGRVEEGTSYTPPSIELQLRAIGSPGTSAAVSFRQFRLRANALVVGDVEVSCDPAVKPAAIGTTLITAPVQPSPP